MSVSLLVGLLTYLNLANIGCSLVLDDISFWTFWRLSWDISGLFQIFFKFPVCLSVCLFAYFLTKIRQKDISSSGWDIFLKIFEDIPGRLLHYSQMITHLLYVCKSVSWLTSLLKLNKYLGNPQLWTRYLSEIYWRYSWDVPTLIPKNSDYLVCL